MTHSKGQLHPVLKISQKRKNKEKKTSATTDLLLAPDLPEVVIAKKAVCYTRLAFGMKITLQSLLYLDIITENDAYLILQKYLQQEECGILCSMFCFKEKLNDCLMMLTHTLLTQHHKPRSRQTT